MTSSLPRPSRRRFLQGTGAAVVANALPGAATAVDPRDRTTTFAFLTDTHFDPEVTDRTKALEAVYAAIAEMDPALVVHGGDVVDDGSPYQYEAYRALVPESLRGKMVHVPGNHDVRFDASAYENHDRYLAGDAFGGTRNSSVVTSDGLHWCLLDPTVTQQSVVRCSEPTLAWLRETLERRGRDRPTVIVVHHPPIGNGYYFLQNSEEFAETIAPFRVRGVLCGHMHNERVTTTNGLTVIAGDDLKDVANGAGYYLVTRVEKRDSDRLKVEFVSVPSPGAAAKEPRPVATVDLGRGRDDSDVEPSTVSAAAGADGKTLAVRASFRGKRDVRSVSAVVYDQSIWAGRDKDGEPWVRLKAQGNDYRGRLPLAKEPPGEHRAIVEVEGTDGARWREIVTFRKEGESFAPLWKYSMGGLVHSALATQNGLVVAGSGSGQVSAFSPRGEEKRHRWTERIGPVYARLAFSADGATVHAPSSDHHLYALDTGNGQRRWRTDLGAPVLADPLVTAIDGQPRILVFADTTLFCLDQEGGSVVWRRQFAVRSMGRAACDGDRVYVGVGDGFGYAIDARGAHDTGWRRKLAKRDDTHGKLTKGPWDCQVLLAGATAILATNETCYGLDVDSGDVAWEKDGSWMFCPPTEVGGAVLIVDESGHAERIDPATGEPTWTAAVPASLFGPGVVGHGDDAYVTSSTGSVHHLDLRTGAHRELRQLTKAGVIATPVLCDEGRVFVVGGMDGRLSAFAR